MSLPRRNAVLEQALSLAEHVRIGGGLPPSDSICTPGHSTEMHVAVSPILLGRGESLFEGIDLPALGYRMKEHRSTEAVRHLVVER